MDENISHSKLLFIRQIETIVEIHDLTLGYILEI